MARSETAINRRRALKLLGAVSALPVLAAASSVAQSDISPFKVHVSNKELADVRRRLASTIWPPDSTGEPWSMGTDLAYMRTLVAYWKDKYDWRTHEAALNKLDHYTTTIDGQKLHFIHQKSRHAGAMPIVVTHGYPGTIWEMLPIAPLLVDPTAHGGTAADAFHVVMPAIPGYPFSGEPMANTNTPRIVELWARLMDKLGYQRYGAYGSDWGSGITTGLGARYPDRLIGTAVPGPPPRTPREPKTDEERAYYASVDEYNVWETAYQRIQGSKPQSLAYGMTDSPAGVAAWVVEKLRAWSDCQGDVERRFSKDQILTLVSLYWHTRTIGTAMRIYYANGLARVPGQRPNVPPQFEPTGKRVPQGYFDFIGIASRKRPPKSLVDKVPENVTLWSYHDKGGHFPAIEEPQLLVGDLRKFFGPLRSA